VAGRVVWVVRFAGRDGALAFAPPTHRLAAINEANQKILGLTLRSRPAWLLAMNFSVYSGQWLAVVGFLPSIYAPAAVASAQAGWLTSLASSGQYCG